MITIHKDFLAPGIERYRIGSLTYQPYHIFRDQRYILAYRPEPLDRSASLNMVKKKVLCQKRQHEDDQEDQGQQSCLKLQCSNSRPRKRNKKQLEADAAAAPAPSTTVDKGFNTINLKSKQQYLQGHFILLDVLTGKILKRFKPLQLIDHTSYFGWKRGLEIQKQAVKQIHFDEYTDTIFLVLENGAVLRYS